MPFGEVVCGAPGSGKSTYCYGKYQLFNALKRPIAVVNLDPANDSIPYPCAIDISSLITLEDVMETHGLGPNGGMLYCMEYLEAIFDWLEERSKELGPEAYVLFDLPGQVELSTNHDIVKNITRKLVKGGFRLAAVHLCDAHYITDASNLIQPTPTLITSMRFIDFNLDFYTEVQDLTYLENTLNTSLPPKYAALNTAMISLIEDFSLVGFETLAVEDKNSMVHLMRVIDRANGYVFVPPPDAPLPPGTIDESKAPPSARPNMFGLF
ncbi:hypothetical protein H1R20_g289, partial [Candolleomyces eurysporus]